MYICFWKVSTKDVHHFRRAVEFINRDYPFSPTFGKATTREECSQASQNVYEKLVNRRGHVLNFDTLCKIAKNPDGTNNEKKVIELVKLFRPKRNGEITKLEFVKSVDR
jgi:Ca2+-binding EF-hand superfamily protein